MMYQEDPESCELSAMARFRLTMRRWRFRHLLIIGVLVAFIFIYRTLFTSQTDDGILDYQIDSKKFDQHRHTGKMNEKQENFNHPIKPAPVQPGIQVLQDNALGDVFQRPVNLLTENNSATENNVKTPIGHRLPSLKFKKPVGFIEDHNDSEIQQKTSIQTHLKFPTPAKIYDKNNFGNHYNDKRVRDQKEMKEPMKESTNIHKEKSNKELNAIDEENAKKEKDEQETIEIENEEISALRRPKKIEPWMRTIQPLNIEKYKSNCSVSSISLPGNSFSTKKFCLVDDIHEYFGAYGDQLCYHKGTNLPKTQRRVLKHHTCECLPGWHGKYCSMPDEVFKGDYPYEYGIGIHSPPRRLILAFPFNKEFDMLETIVHTLHRAVDVFLILESNYTAAGQPKERFLLNALQAQYLKDFQHKIVYISLDYFPRSGLYNGWVIDALLRNHIGDVAFNSVLENVRGSDIIVSVDADEIMTEEALMFLKLHYGYPEPIGFAMSHTVFGYFWQAPDKVTISYGACSVALLKEILHGHLYDLRNGPKNVGQDPEQVQKFKRKHGVKIKPWNFGSKENPTGWHCSWCFLPPGIRNKLISAHASDFPRWGTFEDKTNLPFITKLVANGTWFDEKTHLQYLSMTKDNYAPPFIEENEKRFAYLLNHNLYMNMSKQYLKTSTNQKQIYSPER